MNGAAAADHVGAAAAGESGRWLQAAMRSGGFDGKA